MTDDTDWTLISFEPPKVADVAKAAPATTCPKCGRAIGRGGHFHVKACTGKP
jgi:hypothetical protein